jgi:GNAT superfamily N-acetyltransferase
MVKRTDSDDPDFIALVTQLDAYLRVIDGEEHPFYAQYNKLDKIRHVIVIYENNQAIACGAMKEFDPGTMEIKRMFTSPSARGKGVAGSVLKELEKWASELSYHRCILETGKRMDEAVRLYPRNGYSVIKNFGPYEGVENSVCFEKKLI